MTDKYEPCPCENCITFVMCKDRLYNGHKSQITSLSKHCPMLDDWIANDSTEYKRRSINMTRLLFGLARVEDVWRMDPSWITAQP